MSSPIPYRSDIDGLRAIAIGTVVMFHAFPTVLTGGYMGVDVFFVISGYLISSIIFSQQRKGVFSFREFYVRRICRIFPALVLVLAFTMAAGWLWLLPNDWRTLGRHVLGGSFFFANFVLSGEAGYFDIAAELKPLLHLWSLAIEEQFYLGWPLLVALAFWRRKGLAYLIAAVLIGSFVYNIVRISLHPVATFYLPTSRIWELLIGCVLGYRVQFPESRVAAVMAWGEAKLPADLRAVTGLALIAAGTALVGKTVLFPGWWALLPTVGAALLISAGPAARVNRWLLAHPVMVFIGTISYPLYLWHWPLLSFATIYQGGVPTVEQRAVLVAAAVILSVLTYWCVERPIRFGPVDRRRAAVAFAALCAVIGLGGQAIATGGIKSYASRFGVDPVVQAVGEWAYPTPEMVGETFQRHLLRKVGTGAESILFFGDSNMEQYWPRVQMLHEQLPAARDKTINFLTFGGCPPILDVTEVLHPYCEGFVSAGIELTRQRDIRTVVIGAHWWSYFTAAVGYEIKGVRLRTPEGADMALNALTDMVREFVADGRKVYVILNIPSGDAMDPKTMIKRHLTSFELTPRPVSLATLPQQTALTARMRTELERIGAEVIDPLDYLCGNTGECPTITPDGVPIYKDAGHLRPTYVRSQVTFIDKVFR